MFLIIDTGLQGAHKLPECTKDFFEVEVSGEERSKVLQKLLVKFSLWGKTKFSILRRLLFLNVIFLSLQLRFGGR